MKLWFCLKLNLKYLNLEKFVMYIFKGKKDVEIPKNPNIEEMKDSAQSYIKYYEKLYAKENEKYKKMPFREENSYGVLSIDRSGEKIEVIQVTTDEEGEEDNEPHYMLRTKD